MASALRILVPVDFSEQSHIALEQSYNLARLYDAIVTLLYVVEPQSAVRKVLNLGSDATIEQRKEAALRKLNELAAETRESARIPIQTAVGVGHVTEVVLEQAQQLDATLIVMGTSGKGGIRRKMLGSNAYNTVSESHCPVITIRGQAHRDWCNTIVVPLDLSRETTQKVQRAINFSKLFDGATIRLVSVQWSHDEEVIDRLCNQLEAEQRKVEDQGVECFGDLIRINRSEDDIATTVIGFSRHIDADLIMIMTHQEGAAKRLFVGSTAQSLINNSPIPVMSIVPEVRAQ